MSNEMSKDSEGGGGATGGIGRFGGVFNSWFPVSTSNLNAITPTTLSEESLPHLEPTRKINRKSNVQRKFAINPGTMIAHKEEVLIQDPKVWIFPGNGENHQGYIAFINVLGTEDLKLFLESFNITKTTWPAVPVTTLLIRQSLLQHLAQIQDLFWILQLFSNANQVFIEIMEWQEDLNMNITSVVGPFYAKQLRITYEGDNSIPDDLQMLLRYLIQQFPLLTTISMKNFIVHQHYPKWQFPSFSRVLMILLGLDCSKNFVT